MLKTALCQIFTQPWDIEGNFKRTMQSLEQAAEKGAQLAITPECVFHGYGDDDDQETLIAKVTDIAETLDSPHIKAVCDLAKDKAMNIVIGFAEKTDQGLLHNTAAVISSKGDILQTYHKVHCRTFEDINFAGAFTPGETFQVDEITYNDSSFNLGTMICFDREVTETARCIRSLGAQFIACPLATNTSRLDEKVNYTHNETITQVRATENEVFIAVINHAGRFNGGSFIVGPKGEAVEQLGSDPEVKVVEIPINAVKSKLHASPYSWMGWGFRRPEVYKRYL